MADRSISSPLTLSSSAERMFPTLTASQIDRIAAHGRVRSVRAGEVLVEPGQHVVPFYVVIEGQLEISRPSGAAETLVAIEGTGQFGAAGDASNRRKPGR